MTVTVYTLPACVQCNQTKRVLDAQGTAYTEVDLGDHPLKAEQFRQAGYLAAPIVQAGNQTWSGFKLERLRALVVTEGGRK